MLKQSQKINSLLFCKATCKKLYLLSKVRNHTFIDPRNICLSLNAISVENLLYLIIGFGEEFILYKAPNQNIAFLLGFRVDLSMRIINIWVVLKKSFYFYE